MGINVSPDIIGILATALGEGGGRWDHANWVCETSRPDGLFPFDQRARPSRRGVRARAIGPDLLVGGDANATDSAMKHPGALEGNAGLAPGKAGLAFNFDGDADSILVGASREFLLPNFTIEGWSSPKGWWSSVMCSCEGELRATWPTFVSVASSCSAANRAKEIRIRRTDK